MMAECKTTEKTSYEVKIVRTIDNKRQRANPEYRFQDNKGISGFEDRLNLVNQKDIEWLAHRSQTKTPLENAYCSWVIYDIHPYRFRLLALTKGLYNFD